MEDQEGPEVSLELAIGAGLAAGVIATGLFRVLPTLLNYPLVLGLFAGCFINGNVGWGFRVSVVTAVVTRALFFG